MGLRVEEEDEELGLDLSMHAESAYSQASASGSLGEIARGREPSGAS